MTFSKVKIGLLNLGGSQIVPNIEKKPINFLFRHHWYWAPGRTVRDDRRLARVQDPLDVGGKRGAATEVGQIRQHPLNGTRHCQSSKGELTNRHTTLQSLMNTKLSQHRLWPSHETGLIKTIQTIPHNPCVSSQLPFTVE